MYIHLGAQYNKVCTWPMVLPIQSSDCKCMFSVHVHITCKSHTIFSPAYYGMAYLWFQLGVGTCIHRCVYTCVWWGMWCRASVGIGAQCPNVAGQLRSSCHIIR